VEVVSEPQKVYLATRGGISDYQILHAFARREDAEAYHLTEDIEEYEVRTGPVEVRTLHEIAWVPGEPDSEETAHYPGNPIVWDHPEDFDHRPVISLWGRYKREPRLIVEGFDAAEVRRVYEEQRARCMADPARPR
jgi:hypothetical protein